MAPAELAVGFGPVGSGRKQSCDFTPRQPGAKEAGKLAVDVWVLHPCLSFGRTDPFHRQG